MEYYNLQKSFGSNSWDSEGWYLLWPEISVWFWRSLDPQICFVVVWEVSLVGQSPGRVFLEFILTIYGQNTVTDDDTEPFHGFSDAEILAAGGTIRGPTPSSYPPGYSPQQQPPCNSQPLGPKWHTFTWWCLLWPWPIPSVQRKIHFDKRRTAF